jgi:2,3,4,5-tetrahydropyridine-2,6-dicarboxylate N-succinyltransferase
MTQQLSAIIDAAWDARDGINSATQGEVRDAVQTALNGLDDGSFRVAEKQDGEWLVNQWLKKAVLLSFRLNDNVVVDGGASGAPAYDKVPSKFAGWGENRFRDAGFRVVPGAVARHGSHIAKNVVLMPSFVNIGARVDEERWSILGRRSAVARKSERTSICRAVSASAACSNPCRRDRLSSRTIVSSARAPKWSRA